MMPDDAVMNDLVLATTKRKPRTPGATTDPERLVAPYRPPRRKRGTPQSYPDPDIEAFAAYLALQRGRSRHTVRNYVSDVEQFGRYVDAREPKPGQRPFRGPFMKLRTATPREVNRWIMHLMGQRDALPEKRSPRQFLESSRSVARKLASLREFGRHLRKASIRSDDMTLDVDGPPVRSPDPDPFTKEELRAFFDATLPDLTEWQVRRDRAMFELTYGAGLRISELCGIDLSDVKLEARLVLVHGKGGKSRLAPFTVAAAEAISTYLAVRPQCKTEAMFISWKRRRMSDKGFEAIFNHYAKAANLKGAHPHRLRHSFGTGMAEEGVDSIVLRDIMGHESTQTTAGYVKVSDKRKRHAIDQHPRDHWEDNVK
jgi:integrase/recombinase XerD